jgi:methionyl-tRNA formyltransferase
LRALLVAGYDISFVITKPDAPVGRKRVLTAPAVKITAESNNIVVLQPAHALDLVASLDGHCEAAIVVSYGKILPEAILDLFPKGVINVHASLLPKYRGASPIEAALLNGDAITGVSIMKLDPGMDTGPVYAEAAYEIVPEDNQATLYDKLATIGADVLIDELDSILDGSLIAHPQDDEKASKVGMIKKTDGVIDWSKSAQDILNQIRAYSTWPGSKAIITCEEVSLTEASIYDGSGSIGTPYKTENAELAVYCGQGSIIINHLKPAGKREMTGKEFLAGHPLV